MSDFSTQGLNNTVWAFATLGLLDAPLMSAISASVIALIQQYKAQEHANTLWALAKLAFMDLPLLEALSSSALLKISDFDT